MANNDIVKYIIDSKIIACTASLNPNNEGTCLDLPDAIDVIIESGTRTLVYHVPTDIRSIEDIRTYTWSFLDLIKTLPKSREYILLSNTSRATNANEAIEKAFIGRKIFLGLPHSSIQHEPIIKLEVLDNSFQSDDAAVITAMEKMVLDDQMTVFPLISPDQAILLQCCKIGAPLVRILSGKIGSQSGLLNKSILRKLVKVSPVPLIFEGGLGTPRHVEEALDIGASGVLMNSAFQQSKNPGQLARDIRKVIELKTNRKIFTQIK